MNSFIRISLHTTPEQFAQLQALQLAFAKVCNALAPVVKVSRCWNRVALHHMAYKGLREQFPEIGSQMVCNAIYSVSRTSRLVYQHPQSPFNVAVLGDKPLPALIFSQNSPVYFDRHTLSLKNGVLSLYTLDGRMRFKASLTPHEQELFKRSKLREVVLMRTQDGSFELSFTLSDEATDELAGSIHTGSAEVPEYVLIEEIV